MFHSLFIGSCLGLMVKTKFPFLYKLMFLSTSLLSAFVNSMFSKPQAIDRDHFITGRFTQINTIKILYPLINLLIINFKERKVIRNIKYDPSFRPEWFTSAYSSKNKTLFLYDQNHNLWSVNINTCLLYTSPSPRD